jgi:hypothetical protein
VRVDISVDLWAERSDGLVLVQLGLRLTIVFLLLHSRLAAECLLLG